MSEQKSQGWFVPLRVRFRSPTERAQWEREHPGVLAADEQTLQLQLPTLGSEPEALRRTQQIKELIRLGNVLRAQLDFELDGLNEVLQQIGNSISACTGFRVLVINLVEPGSEYVVPVAFAGASEEGERIVRESRMTIEQLLGLMRGEFRISQSYYISHEHAEVFSDIVVVTDKTPGSLDKGVPREGLKRAPLRFAEGDYEAGSWHPEDALIVPLYSPRKQGVPRDKSGDYTSMKKLLGFLSLNDPEDGKLPTLESIEVVELFASQAAIAIDNARIFQEREAERLALEEAIALLRRDLEQVQEGDLRVRIRVRSSHERSLQILQPVADAINTMVVEISEILGDVQMVTQAVDEHTQKVQQSSELLVRDASQQEQQVHNISRVIDEMAITMHHISERAAKIAHVAVEAMDVTLEGQSAVDRAVDGMGQVREATMQSARVMKRLGESGQEINDTVLTITDLTTRMNLLALNAAIEAVRAGEHGQGFAVLAQEMRSLATHSAEAARKVATSIRAIQQETATAAVSVEQNTRQVVMQTELVTQTGVALDAISVVTEQMADLVQDIAKLAERLSIPRSAASAKLAERVSIPQAQGSHLMIGSVEGISRMTSEITQNMRQMQQSLTHLVDLTNSLRSRVSVFRISP
jgi:methyl-accepting chemotaxis protein